MKFQKAERVGTAVSVALISPSTFTDVQAVSEKVRKASQRAYRGLVSHKVTISCSATSFFLCSSCFLHMSPVRTRGWRGGGGVEGWKRLHSSEQKQKDSAV